MDLKDLRQPEDWPVLLAAVGAAIAIAAIAVGQHSILLMGLGIALFGVGERKNHRREEQPLRDVLGNIAWKRVRFERHFSPTGIALDALGGLLFFFGLFWLVAFDMLA